MTAEFEKAFPLLTERLGRDSLKLLLESARSVECPDGAVITRDGQPVDTLYFILDGVLSVAVEQDGRSLQLGRIGKGKWIGEVSLFSGTPIASSTVTAEGPVRLLALRHADFESLRKDHVEAAGRLTHLLVEILIERLRATSGQPVRTADGRLMLPGSETVQQLREKPDRGWLKTALQKLIGIEREA